MLVETWTQPGYRTNRVTWLAPNTGQLTEFGQCPRRSQRRRLNKSSWESKGQITDSQTKASKWNMENWGKTILPCKNPLKLCNWRIWNCQLRHIIITRKRRAFHGSTSHRIIHILNRHGMCKMCSIYRIGNTLVYLPWILRQPQHDQLSTPNHLAASSFMSTKALERKIFLGIRWKIFWHLLSASELVFNQTLHSQSSTLPHKNASKRPSIIQDIRSTSSSSHCVCWKVV